MKCRLGGECELVSRAEILGRPDVAQCARCSEVYIAAGWVRRTCDACRRPYGESLHDPCLGTLEGVTQACCGHGDSARAYRVYSDGRVEGRLP